MVCVTTDSILDFMTWSALFKWKNYDMKLFNNSDNKWEDKSKTLKWTTTVSFGCQIHTGHPIKLEFFTLKYIPM